jgi:hypothetical protein
MRSLDAATTAFDDWLEGKVTEEMANLSKKHITEFTKPLRRVGRQLSQSLQDFRNRLSERTLTALGVPLGDGDGSSGERTSLTGCAYRQDF